MLVSASPMARMENVLPMVSREIGPRSPPRIFSKLDFLSANGAGGWVNLADAANGERDRMSDVIFMLSESAMRSSFYCLLSNNGQTALVDNTVSL